MTLEQIKQALAESGITAELVDDSDVPGGFRLDVNTGHRECVIIQPATDDIVAKLGLRAPHYEVYLQTWGPDTRWEPGVSDDPRMWTLADAEAVVPVALAITRKVMKENDDAERAEAEYEARLAEEERAADERAEAAERFEMDGGAAYYETTYIY